MTDNNEWHSNECDNEKHEQCCYAQTGCTCWCHNDWKEIK